MKKVAIVFMLFIVMVICCSCGNKDFWDTTYTFNYAQIKMPDGSFIEGCVETWADYENSDQIQVKIDGITYLTHATNIVLTTKAR